MLASIRVTACVLFTAYAYSGPLTAQDTLESFGRGIAWRINEQTPRGSIAGLVLSDAGVPIEGAQVSLSGTSIGALTSGDGTFTVTPPLAGEWELRVELIGYRYLRDTISVPHDHGVFVTALLQPSSMHGLCGTVVCVGTACDDLNVEVLDSITGRTPTATVELRLEHETGVQVNSVRLQPGAAPYGHVGIGHRIQTAGVHSIQVSAPGYRPWRIEGVHLRVVPGCIPMLLNRDYVARLVPIAQRHRLSQLPTRT